MLLQFKITNFKIVLDPSEIILIICWFVAQETLKTVFTFNIFMENKTTILGVKMKKNEHFYSARMH